MNNTKFLPHIDFTKLQKTIYRKQGYCVVKNFLDDLEVNMLKSFWIHNKEKDYQFADKVKNSDVNIHTLPYKIEGGKSRRHTSYCMSVFSSPIDEITHEIIFKAVYLRNKLMDLPIYESLLPSDEYCQQYRVVISTESGVIVKPHADYLEEERADSLVSHSYDPSRLQMTLLLTQPGTDFDEQGGFYLKPQNSQRLYSKELDIKSGDLLIWMYNIKHGVDNIVLPACDSDGFARIIFPLFENKKFNA